MNNEEAIEILDNAKFKTNKDADYAIRVFDAIEKAEQALEKVEKYKWHDLRKDPKDLPDEIFSKSYLIMTDCGYAISKFYGYGEEAQGFREFPYGVWEANGYGMDVIAWKYIEVFEE